MKKFFLAFLVLIFSLSAFAQKSNPPGLDLIKEAELAVNDAMKVDEFSVNNL